ncbi:MAG: prolipoprotein diacylglyceryl transferase [Gallionella sp.]|nr:prolipoprotein diacylglyceryl transferase [Gallionella sp.]
MTAVLHNVIVYWGVAVVIVLATAAWQADRYGLDSWSMYLAGLLGFGGALLLGGEYATLLVSSAHMHEDSLGRGAVGALFGATLGAWGVLKMRGVPFLSYADAAAPAVALGYAVYRIGCVLNGCCFGIETDLPWAVTFGADSEAFAAQVAVGLIVQDALHTLPVHPTQLYHALLGVVIFLVLLRMRIDVHGKRFAVALILYGAGRFVIEFFRGDAIPILGPLDANHFAALVMLVIGIVLWRFRTGFVAAIDWTLTT